MVNRKLTTKQVNSQKMDQSLEMDIGGYKIKGVNNPDGPSGVAAHVSHDGIFIASLFPPREGVPIYVSGKHPDPSIEECGDKTVYTLPIANHDKGRIEVIATITVEGGLIKDVVLELLDKTIPIPRNLPIRVEVGNKLQLVVSGDIVYGIEFGLSEYNTPIITSANSAFNTIAQYSSANNRNWVFSLFGENIIECSARPFRENIIIECIARPFLLMASKQESA